MHVEDNKSQGPCLVSFPCRPVSPPPQSWRHQPVTHHTKPEVTKFQTLGHIGTPPKLRSTETKAYYCPALHPHPLEWSVWLLWLMSVVALPSRLPSQSPAFTSPCQCVPACAHQELCARSYCQCAYICVYRKWTWGTLWPKSQHTIFKYFVFEIVFNFVYASIAEVTIKSTSYATPCFRLTASHIFVAIGAWHTDIRTGPIKGVVEYTFVTHWHTVATFVTHWHIHDFWTLDGCIDFN